MTPPLALRSERRRRYPIKIVVTGGFGAGTSTFVATVSDTTPVTAEGAPTTSAGPAAPRYRQVEAIAFDFGRFDLGPELNIFAYGLPSQDRFSFTWPRLACGALGGILLVDADRIAASSPAAEKLRTLGLPFLVVVNAFDSLAPQVYAEVYRDLGIPSTVPVTTADVRDRGAARSAVAALLRYAVACAGDPTPTAEPKPAVEPKPPLSPAAPTVAPSSLTTVS